MVCSQRVHGGYKYGEGPEAQALSPHVLPLQHLVALGVERL